jgi:hypothetical protein
MKNRATGTYLCILCLGIVAGIVLDRPVQRASAVDFGATASSAVTSAAMAQTAPTIVWYSVTSTTQGFGSPGAQYVCSSIWRAWSDGRVEVRQVRRQITGYNGNTFDTWCNPDYTYCSTPWVVVSDAAQGQAYRSDINFDAMVDAADLGQLLADWGEAPRQDIPPSSCPLNLINP